MLVAGPNLLVGGPAGVIALFVPTVADIGEPASLLQRLTATRLAFPPQTRCVLWLATDAAQVLADLSAIVLSEADREMRRVPEDIQRGAYLRAHALLHETERLTRDFPHPAATERLESDLLQLGYRQLPQQRWGWKRPGL